MKEGKIEDVIEANVLVPQRASLEGEELEMLQKEDDDARLAARAGEVETHASTPLECVDEHILTERSTSFPSIEESKHEESEETQGHKRSKRKKENGISSYENSEHIRSRQIKTASSSQNDQGLSLSSTSSFESDQNPIVLEPFIALYSSGKRSKNQKEEPISCVKVHKENSDGNSDYGESSNNNIYRQRVEDTRLRRKSCLLITIGVMVICITLTVALFQLGFLDDPTPETDGMTNLAEALQAQSNDGSDAAKGDGLSGLSSSSFDSDNGRENKHTCQSITTTGYDISSNQEFSAKHCFYPPEENVCTKDDTKPCSSCVYTINDGIELACRTCTTCANNEKDDNEKINDDQNLVLFELDCSNILGIQSGFVSCGRGYLIDVNGGNDSNNKSNFLPSGSPINHSYPKPPTLADVLQTEMPFFPLPTTISRTLPDGSRCSTDNECSSGACSLAEAIIDSEVVCCPKPPAESNESITDTFLDMTRYCTIPFVGSNTIGSISSTNQDVPSFDGTSGLSPLLVIVIESELTGNDGRLCTNDSDCSVDSSRCLQSGYNADSLQSICCPEEHIVLPQNTHCKLMMLPSSFPATSNNTSSQNGTSYPSGDLISDLQLGGESCLLNRDCENNACGFNSGDLTGAKLICCPSKKTVKGPVMLVGNAFRYCTGLPRGTACRSNAMCDKGLECDIASNDSVGFCSGSPSGMTATTSDNIAVNATNNTDISSILNTEEIQTDIPGNTDTLLIVGEKCQRSSQCQNNACALQSKSRVANSICCPSGKFVSVGRDGIIVKEKNYCTNNVPVGGSCDLDEMCADVTNENNAITQTTTEQNYNNNLSDTSTSFSNATATNSTALTSSTTTTPTSVLEIKKGICINEMCTTTLSSSNKPCEKHDHCIHKSCGYESAKWRADKICCTSKNHVYYQDEYYCADLSIGDSCAFDSVCGAGLMCNKRGKCAVGRKSK
mmetsp:Transcript_26004/g.31891  ORF Transcript_26004/g.31891 Transcript_26004/m.31891 type:complete len:956 (+) Transcript_26004:205-3072(+)